jgi:hypothetical protein
MLDPQDHSDFFKDEESDTEVTTGTQMNYTSHDLEKELRDILGDSYDDGADVIEGEVDVANLDDRTGYLTVYTKSFLG